jgi:hypothetical protein
VVGGERDRSSSYGGYTREGEARGEMLYYKSGLYQYIPYDTNFE